MTMLAGSARAVQPNVRQMDVENTYDDQRKWQVRYADDPNRDLYENGLRWSASRLTGGDIPQRIVFEMVLDRESGSESRHRITGQTLDATGAPLGNVTITGFLTNAYAYAGLLADAVVGEMTSDPAGYYEFWTPYAGQQHYLVMYLPGTPARTGGSVNTLVPVAP